MGLVEELLKLLEPALHELLLSELFRAKRKVRQIRLLLLHVKKSGLDGLLDDELDGDDWACLSQTVDTVHGLVLDGRIPAKTSAKEGT